MANKILCKIQLKLVFKFKPSGIMCILKRLIIHLLLTSAEVS